MKFIAALGDRAAAVASRVIPDPTVIAIVLAAVTVVAGGLYAGDPLKVTGALVSGMMTTGLLAFGFKMALILVTGYALADAPAVQGILRRLAAIPNTPSGAAALVAAVAMLLALLNWGLGLVGGAFAAREVTRAFQRRGQALNPALIAAAGYMGMMVWHGGLSGSAPLDVASAGGYGDALPVDATVFSGMNLTVNALLLVLVPLLFAALGRTPDGGGDKPPAERATVEAPGTDATADDDADGPLSWLERSVLVSACFILPVGVALGQSLLDKGAGAINLNTVILAFWAAGMALHKDPLKYSRSFGEGAKDAGGILLQFPIYFGILAAARESGMLAASARALNDVAGSLPLAPETASPVMTFLTAGLVNLLVPSGGGQWALQQPIILEAVNAFSLDRAKMVMAFAYGDQLTNLLQPFWALPLLSITGLKARDVMGFTVLVMLLAAPIFLVVLALF